jgi:HEPN domain-containing protein
MVPAASPSPPPNEHRAYAHLLLRKARSHRIALDHVGLDPTFADTIVGFHAQQTVEKLIEAVLCHNQIAYPHVNDLDRLLQLLEAEQITQPPGPQQLVSLTLWATHLRYEDPPEPISLNRRATVTLVDRHAGRRRRRLGISPDAQNADAVLSPETSRRPTTLVIAPLRSRRGAVP